MYSISSTGAPLTSINATVSPALGELGLMMIFFPLSSALRSSTSNATCGTVFTSSGYGAFSQYRCHYLLSINSTLSTSSSKGYSKRSCIASSTVSKICLPSAEVFLLLMSVIGTIKSLILLL